MTLHAIDPGKRKHAIAIFDAGRLAGLTMSAAGISGARQCVIEKPRVYQSATGKDPNDLIDLSISIGRVARDYERDGVPVRFVEARAWKGSAKKPTSHRRIWSKLSASERLVVSVALKLPEAAIWKKIEDACKRLAVDGRVTGYQWRAHNLLDAIGIGLKESKR